MSKKLRHYQIEGYNAVFDRLQKGVPRQMLVLATGLGKAQPLTAKVLSKNGWITMKDVVPGMELANPRGGLSTVTQIYPQGLIDVYRITFDDRSKTECCENHLWECTTKSRKNRNLLPFVLSLKDIMKRNISDLYFPIVNPIQYKQRAHLIDPYLLGLLIGDGALSKNVSFSSIDREILDNVKLLIPTECTLKFKDRCNYGITVKKGEKNPIINELRRLNLFGKKSNRKFIPNEYLHSSISDRISVLQGLMDTDGTIVKSKTDKSSTVVLTTVSISLRDTFIYLIRSLGGIAKFSVKKPKYTYNGIKKNGQIAYNITFKLPVGINPFRLKRKANNFKIERKYLPTRRIVSIEYIGKKESKCITLDSENKLYITDDFIVTHNTFLASSIAHKFNKVLFMCHTEELIEQGGIAMIEQFYPESHIKQRVAEYGGLIEYFRANNGSGMFRNVDAPKFGIIKADCFDIDAPITLASFQTIHRRLDRIPANHFDLIIIDECHLSGANSILKTLNYFDTKLRLGLTATPHRMDGVLLGDIFDEIVYQYNIADGVKDGYLVELDAMQIKTKLNLDQVRTTAGEFNNKDLQQAVDTPERNQLLVDKYKQYADGKQNLVFCVDIEHAKNVTETFRKNGMSAEYVVGDKELTPDRREVIERFKRGQIQHLVNVMVLTAGFDYPGIGCITLACPTKSLTKFMQQLGRGTRTLPGVIDGLDTPEERIAAIKASAKPKCVILDIVDTTSRHRLINTFELDKDKPIQDKVFMTSETKLKLFETAQRRQANVESQKQKDNKVDLLELPKVKYSNSMKMKEAATEKQLEYLKNLGYFVEDINYTKAMANQLISNAPATEAQIKFLKWKGYDVSNGVTRGEASLAFEEIKKRDEENERKKQTPTNSPINDVF